MNPKRVPFTVLATMMFLVVSFNSTPSDTAIPDPFRLPDSPPESQALQDLAKWVVQSRPQPIDTGRLHAITESDLDAALSEMEVSPEEDAEAARREVLVKLPYGSQIWRTAQKHHVDGLLVAAIVEAESGFTPYAVSPKGAVGLMQLLPSTGGTYGTPDLFEPSANLEVGTRYLAWLLREFDGDLERTLAAYNAGPATVARYNGVPPYRETRKYVRKVLAIYRGHSETVWKRAGWGRDPFVALPVKSAG